MAENPKRREVGYVFNDRYQVVKCLGEGGLSCVYEVIDLETRRPWALKEYRSQNHELIQENMNVEGNILTRLKHRGIPYVVNISECESGMFIVMDRVSGISLRSMLKAGGADIAPEKMANYFLQICDILSYLHNHKPQLIHRDIKPGNIMLQTNGEIALIDFGTIRMYRKGLKEDESRLGTQAYASPEQKGLIRQQTDGRSDIYSFGLLMYRMLTGRNVEYASEDIDDRTLDISAGYRRIIKKCIEYQPRDRFQTIEEVRHAIVHKGILGMEREQKDVAKIKSFNWVVFSTIIALVASLIMGIGGYRMDGLSIAVVTAAIILVVASVALFIGLRIPQVIRNRRIQKEVFREKDEEELERTRLLIEEGAADDDILSQLARVTGKEADADIASELGFVKKREEIRKTSEVI